MLDYVRTAGALRPCLPLLLALAILLQQGCGRETPRPAAGRDSAAVFTMIDAVGEKIELRETPRRVISLAPNLTEIVFAVGAGGALVGRTSYCDYPAEALKVPVVGDMLTLNYETIISRKPDLVLMSIVGNLDANYRKLRDLGIQTVALGADSIGQAIATIDTVGMLLGHRAEAARLVGRLRGEIDSISGLAAGKPKVTTFVVIDKSPLITVSKGFIAEAVEMAGGENIAANEATGYPKYSREELLRRNPEVLLVPGSSWSEVDDLLKAYPEWKDLRAVREKRVYLIPRDLVTRPGPRIPQGLGVLYEALHGAEPRTLAERYFPATEATR
jgi:iron complex transport system substrate-binding protein